MPTDRSAGRSGEKSRWTQFVRFFQTRSSRARRGNDSGSVRRGLCPPGKRSRCADSEQEASEDGTGAIQVMDHQGPCAFPCGSEALRDAADLVIPILGIGPQSDCLHAPLLRDDAGQRLGR